MIIRISNPQKHIPTVLVILFSILIIGGCYSTYDYETYRHFYNGVSSYIGMEEGYALIVELCNRIGMTYEEFRFALFACSYIVIGRKAYKVLGKYTPLFFILYFIIPMSYDAYNMRNLIVNVFLFIAFLDVAYYDKKHCIVEYVIMLLIGSMFHRTSFFYLIFIYAFIRSKKQEISSKRKRNEILILLVVLFSSMLVFSNALLQGVGDFIERVLVQIANLPMNKASYFEIQGRYGYLLYVLCHLSFTFTIGYLRSGITEKSNSLSNYEMDDMFRSSRRLVDVVYLCNIILIAFLPAIKLTIELYRVYRGVMLLEYVAFLAGVRCLDRGSNKKVLSCIFLILSVGLNFYIMMRSHIDITFTTLFTDNFFLDWLW